MSGRWRWVAVVLAVAAIVAGVVVVVAGRGTHPAATSPRAVARPPVLRALAAAPSTATTSGVARALRTAMRDPAFGGQLSGDVVDGASGRQLLDRDDADPLPPASTVKLLTAAAALTALGPDATLSTDVVHAGDTLYLVGGGDVTLRAAAPAGPVGYPPAATLTDLAARTATTLRGDGVPVRVCIDTSAWQPASAAPGWSPGYVTGGDIAPLSPLEVDEGAATSHHRARAPIARVGDPAAQAGAAFVTALRHAGVAVRGTVCRAPAPAAGLGVATVSSAPVAALVQRMLTLSDNDLAEALGRAVAKRTGHPADFAGEAAAVTEQARALGIDLTGVQLYDASGLSRLDRVTAHSLVALLRLAVAASQPRLRPIADGLPVAGLTGTLAGRYRRGAAAAAAGVARAKTGTLAGVNTIAGYVVDADGGILVFAFLTDRATSPDATEAALDRLVGRLATCGCR